MAEQSLPSVRNSVSIQEPSTCCIFRCSASVYPTKQQTYLDNSITPQHCTRCMDDDDGCTWHCVAVDLRITRDEQRRFSWSSLYLEVEDQSRHSVQPLWWVLLTSNGFISPSSSSTTGVLVDAPQKLGVLADAPQKLIYKILFMCRL